MELKGEERIAASRDVVWKALNDPAVLQQCIPGCQSLEWISPTQLAVQVKIRIGIVSASFSGEITLSNVKAPESYTLHGEGKGGIAALAKAGVDVMLTPDGGETILGYDAGAEIGGRLAQLGSRLVASTASKFARKFFADFSAAVQAKAAGPS